MLHLLLLSYYIWYWNNTFLLLVPYNRYPIQRSSSIPICRYCSNRCLSNTFFDFFRWPESLSSTHILKDHLMGFISWLVVLLNPFCNTCSSFHHDLILIMILKCTVRLWLDNGCPPFWNFHSPIKGCRGLRAWLWLLMLYIPIQNTYDAISLLYHLSLLGLSLYTFNRILLLI